MEKSKSKTGFQLAHHTNQANITIRKYTEFLEKKFFKKYVKKNLQETSINSRVLNKNKVKT